MITLRRDTDRRHIRSSKHDTWGTFYPQEHPDPLVDGFGILALFNETRLPPGGAFGPCRNDEAEVVTYVYKGALAQEDSTGNSGVIYAGEFQCMTNGRAIRCKETNASRTDWAHVFRISLRPLEVGLACANKQKRFTAAQRRNVLCVVASVDARHGSLHIHQDALIYSAILDSGQHLVHALLEERIAWLHIVTGEATLGDLVLSSGDGVGVTFEPAISFTAREGTEMLLLDLKIQVQAR